MCLAMQGTRVQSLDRGTKISQATKQLSLHATATEPGLQGVKAQLEGPCAHCSERHCKHNKDEAATHTHTHTHTHSGF